MDERGRRRYISYLLRVWQTDSQGRRVWRASLEDAQTGERRGFAELDALFTYLLVETGLESGDEATQKDTPTG